MKRYAKYIMAILLLTLAARAEGGTAYTGAATGNWANPASWSPNGVPGTDPTDTIVGINSSVTITATTGYSLTSIAASTAAGGGIVLSGGSLTLSGGTCITYSGNNNANAFIQASSGVNVISTTGANVLFAGTSVGNTWRQGGGTSALLAPSGTVALCVGANAVIWNAAGVSTVTGAAVLGSNASSYGCVYVNGGTLTFNGLPILAGTTHIPGQGNGNSPLHCTTGGNINWTGTYSVNSGQTAAALVLGGSLNLSGLSLSNSGQVIFVQNGGTLSQGGGVITQSLSTANCAGVAFTPVVTGPTLPTVDKVLSPTTYGYSATQLTGTASAGGNLAQTASNTLTSGWYYTDTAGGTAAGTYAAPTVNTQSQADQQSAVKWGVLFGPSSGYTGTWAGHGPLRGPAPLPLQKEPPQENGILPERPKLKILIEEK